MVIAEVSVVPVGTEKTGVSEYVAAAVSAFESSGLRCTLEAMGTTVEAESREEFYRALDRAQEAVFEAGARRVYTVVKMDERRDETDRSPEEMVRAVRERQGRAS